jgi:hypothetical protein
MFKTELSAEAYTDLPSLNDDDNITDDGKPLPASENQIRE